MQQILNFFHMTHRTEFLSLPHFVLADCSINTVNDILKKSLHTLNATKEPTITFLEREGGGGGYEKY